MRLTLLLILLLVLPSISAAQANKITLGVTLIPKISRPMVQSQNAPYSYNPRITSTGAFGLSLRYAFNEKLLVYSGLWYSIERYSVDISNIFLESNNFNIETQVKEDLLITGFTLPLRFAYSLNRQWQVMGGLGLQIPLMNSRNRLVIEDGKIVSEASEVTQRDLLFQKGRLSLNIGLVYVVRNRFLDFQVSPQFWIHTHTVGLPLNARTNWQSALGLELSTWIY